MWLDLQIFGFRALWSPYFFVFTLILALLYFLITGPYRHKFGNNESPNGKQQVFFYSALILLYVVKGSPIDLLTHIMLTAHMIQMAIFYLIFPIFIIKGIPVWIWRKVVLAPVIKPVIKVITKPLITLLLFNALFSLYHIPEVFDFSKSSLVAHTSISLIILFAAFLVWWPILAPVKELDKMTPLLKIGYIVANGALFTPACVLIIFANDPLFAAYSQGGAWMQAMALCVPGDVLSGLNIPMSGPELFSPLSALEDQRLGGIIMKLTQEFVYGLLLARVFYKWFNRESLKIDPLPSTSVPETQH